MVAGSADGICKLDFAGSQAEVQSFGSPPCAGRGTSGSFVEAATGIATGKSKTADCAD